MQACKSLREAKFSQKEVALCEEEAGKHSGRANVENGWRTATSTGDVERRYKQGEEEGWQSRYIMRADRWHAVGDREKRSCPNSQPMSLREHKRPTNWVSGHEQILPVG